MDSTRPTVAIVGGGFSGIVSAKTAIEHGLEPTVFERKSQIGGNWSPKYGKVWNSMRAMDNKYAFHFKDLDYPDDTDEIPSPSDVYAYMLAYIDKFKLQQYIKLSHKVDSALILENNRWEVTTLEEQEDKAVEHRQVFDFVIIACGALCDPLYTKIDGVDNFKGTVIHASKYRTAKDFADKRVVVIGGAVTGGQIAVDLVGSASHVTSIQESPVFVAQTRVLNDKGTKKVPFTTVMLRRVCVAAEDEVENFANVAENLLDLTRVPPHFKRIAADGLCDLYPMDGTEQGFQALGYSDHYVDYVRDGIIDLKRHKAVVLKEKSVVLSNGEEVLADAVILATGSKLNLSFLDKRVLKAAEFYEHRPWKIHSILYKYTWVKGFQNVAFVGMWLVPGPNTILAELTAQWACMVFSKKLMLPDESKMHRFLESMRQRRSFVPEQGIPCSSCVSLFDAVASEIGALPGFSKIKDEDLQLFERLMYSTVIPAHYQLTGPFADPLKARADIEQVWTKYQA